MLEAVTRGDLYKKVFLKFSQNSQENTCARASFLIKLQAEICNLISKETLAQLLSCEFCEIFKNTFFYRKPLDDCLCITYGKILLIAATIFFNQIDKNHNETDVENENISLIVFSIHLCIIQLTRVQHNVVVLHNGISYLYFKKNCHCLFLFKRNLKESKP